MAKGDEHRDSKKPTSKEDMQQLLARIDELTAKLAESEAGREAAEKARTAAQANLGLLYADVVEVPTGETVDVRMLDRAKGENGYETVGYRDDAGGRPILRPIFKTEKVPTYHFKVDLPPSGGWEIKLNGIAFYHGETYVLDKYTLATVKDIVARMWAHERNIRGEDENERAYRTPTERVLRGPDRGAMRRRA